MKLLAIDTSGEACSAALHVDGETLQALEIAPRRHSELILPMMQGLLEGAALELADLDALAFARGPGSFTGVRIATAVIQGAAFAASLPVVPISTLAAIAQGQFRRGGQRRLLPALDARMDEVYWGCYQIAESGLATASAQELVCAPDRIPIPSGVGWTGVGSGWESYAAVLRQRLESALDAVETEVHCEARDIAELAVSAFGAGEHVAPEAALPVYLRDQVTRAP